ncbi:jmjC domain-containing protein 7-like isoform X1 [Centruroides sculpturatus]|uniref:jmjC domain-containing protein 7-like isoform X1 n=1 Tax=Centruroides sculpturatus TaxID=218467 RepID=UPI000C6E9EC2|nr:jmjC domain-containing protein 7-like isoform X1 [Centruroides sculpturatus]XP_023235212.1 jmjC domain-containing protein 7-like isoform X1 [Centruroides sculpturatus]
MLKSIKVTGITILNIILLIILIIIILDVIIFVFVISFQTCVPNGHLQPLGFHASPIKDGIKILNYFPHPNEFWNEYVANGKPVIFHNIAKSFNAFGLWTDDYLRLHYGHMEVTVERQKKENRTSEVTLMLFSEFLQKYQKEDLYVITVLHSEWLSDISLPKPILCGNLQNSLNHINLWMSNGETKSVLHRDSMDNIHCILDGRKELFLVNKELKDYIIYDDNEEYSTVDVDSVDMYQHPGLQEISWYNASINSGDCIFIPYMWFHQVTSSKGRNVAINWWMNHLLWFNLTDCNDKELEEWLPSYSFEFPNLSSKQKYQLLQFIDGYNNLTYNEFKQIYEEIKCKNSNLRELFVKLDEDENNYITLEELYQADSVYFKSYFTDCDDSFNHDKI